MSRLRASVERLVAEPLSASTRNAAAVALAALAFSIGGVAFASGHVESGVRLSLEGDGRVYIADIDPWSPAWDYGLGPGMVVVAINERALVPLPDLEGGEPVTGEALVSLLGEGILTLAAIEAWELESLLAGATENYNPRYVSTGPWQLHESGIAPLLGLAVLAAGGWWLSTGRGGPTLRGLTLPIIVATATPLLLVPALPTATALGLVLVAVVLPLGILPLADGLSGLVPHPSTRRVVRLGAFGASVLALLSGLSMLALGDETAPSAAQWLAAGAIAFIPGFVAARPSRALTGGSSPSGRVVESLELAAVGATPFVAGFALVNQNSPGFILPVVLWIAALLVAQRYTVRPLARLVNRATLQRDLVVAATEAERARIAADLHDETLQDLTLLVRQLDARGDLAGAEAGRRIAERVRTLTGELRLPILDDLGVGPALEWLVARMERIAGGEVRLERDDGSRLPPDIELAFFRVAQEALANAVKHGRPPILVRFRSESTGAALTIDDAGPGILPGATEAAPAAGHFGLLGMQQRAEQIGALLDVRRWPGGGTHVTLEWRAP
jgi:signal transduction histidine kinase